jgi:hypothetical protein
VRQASLGTGLMSASIGSVATRALTEDSVEIEFLTDDAVAQGQLPASDVRRAGSTLRLLWRRYC